MADKSPRQHSAKKPSRTIKEKRADKKAKAASHVTTDEVSHLRHQR